MTNKKIAVVNRTNLKNFGSVLQVYALCEAINKIGHDAEVVWQDGNISRNFDIRPNKVISIILKLIFHPKLLSIALRTAKGVKAISISEEKVRKFDTFVVNNIKQTLYSPKELHRIAKTEKYFKFICGSDQIWCTTTLYPDPLMYLRFAPKEKRVAYAPSLGRNYIPSYNKRIIKKYINGIHNVSVREDDGKDLIFKLTGRLATVVADPTLLLTKDEWDRIKIDIAVPSQYVLCYFLDTPTEETCTAIADYAEKRNLDIVILGSIGNLNFDHNRIHYPVAGPGEFLTLISNSNAVITDSYHGMLFAINYRKEFWSIERVYEEYDQSSRQLTLLKRLDLLNRYIPKNDSEIPDDDINYDIVVPQLKSFIKDSYSYLSSSI